MYFGVNTSYRKYMEYIKFCIIPVFIEMLVSIVIFTCVSVCELYDKKVRRELSEKSKKILFLCPSFTRYLRFRTQWLCIGAQILLAMQLLTGGVDLHKFRELYREQYVFAIEILWLAIIVCSIFPSAWNILWTKIKTEKNQGLSWDPGVDIQEEDKLFGGKMIEKVKISYKRDEIPGTLLVLLPPEHRINCDGFLKGTRNSFNHLKKKLPFMEREELVIGNSSLYKDKISKLKFFVEYSNYSFYLHNYGNYRKLSHELNRINIAALRIEYAADCDRNTYEQLEDELGILLSQIKNEYKFSNIIFCGHGVYGSIETILLSQKIESKGICILGEAGIGLRQQERAYIESLRKKRWITNGQYGRLKQSLDKDRHGCRGNTGSIYKEFCPGGRTEYYDSLAEYTSESLTDMLNTYGNFVLNIRFGNDMCLSGKKDILITKEKSKTYFLPGLYSTFRQPGEKDYAALSEVSRCELRQDIKSKPGRLLLEHEIEISEELMTILKTELHHLLTGNGSF